MTQVLRVEYPGALFVVERWPGGKYVTLFTDGQDGRAERNATVDAALATLHRWVDAWRAREDRACELSTSAPNAETRED